MDGRHYVFAGGGTGGHLFPGLAVANALCRFDPQAQVTFFTTTRPLDRDLLRRTPYRQIEQPVRPLTMRPWKLAGFWWAWRESVAAARAWLKQHRPRAVLGLGGYAAGPPIVAARSLGLRSAILNPDAIPGRANRYLARRANLVVLQWEVSRRHFPARTNCQALGCPVRPAFASADRLAGRQHFGLDPQRPLLLVTGASQGARSVNQTMYRVWPEFVAAHPEWQLLHLTGPTDKKDTQAAYASAAAPARVLAFTHEMHLAVAAADAVLARAGASTLAELTTIGRPAILMPYPYHRDRHQNANARVLVDAGAAAMVEDQKSPEANRAPLRAALEEVADAARRHGMAAAAKALGRPSAAEDVAAWLRG